MFVEFFPDPTEVGDNEGEFVEIRLDDFRAESLYVSFEQKAPLSFPFPRSANRMVLVHDSTLCPRRDSLACLRPARLCAAEFARKRVDPMVRDMPGLGDAPGPEAGEGVAACGRNRRMGIFGRDVWGRGSGL